MVKLFRAILDAVAPAVMLITETNVPHEENVSYFGDGTDEAQLVYQFPLPPLVLYSIAAGDAGYLTAWASDLALTSDQTTFYNFLASHDGIGVRPVEGILAPDEVQVLVDRTLAHGGHVSYKTNTDGSQSVYELNISYFDALSDPNADEPLTLQVQRFMASQAIMLALRGIPAIYVHSLFGSRNDYEGVARTGRYRSINREKFCRDALESALSNPDSRRARVFNAYRHILQVRAQHPAFHPNGSQQVLTLDAEVFAVVRTSPDGSDKILCLTHVSDTARTVHVDTPFARAQTVCDILTKETFPVQDGALTLDLVPYQVLWLKEVEA